MLTIWKYRIEADDEQDLMLPEGAKVLSFMTQGDMPFVWVLVDPEAQLKQRSFVLRGTGHEIDIPQEHLSFIGSVSMRGGSLIFHLFELV